MPAKYILAAVAAIFFVAAATRLSRDGALTAKSRTWLLVGAIMAVVSAWLWLRQ